VPLHGEAPQARQRRTATPVAEVKPSRLTPRQVIGRAYPDRDFGAAAETSERRAVEVIAVDLPPRTDVLVTGRER